MAFKIEDNKITLTRGDTFITEVRIYQDDNRTEAYTPAQGDSVRFALKSPKMTSGNRAYRDEEPLILKDIPISSMILQLDPEDTKPLDFGEYVYDMELTKANGVVSTFITETPFILTPEVY